MRNLTKTLTAISLLAPVSAFPLGIGDIKLHSALNQNLDAEIALLVSAGENVSDLRIKLAPPEKFDEAGVPWNYFLSKIKFETVKTSNGSTVIKVSSNEALREPFLDFLVEVSWDKGNLYREFTVLVDPPVAYTQSVIPVIQKSNQLVEVKPDEPKKPTAKRAKVDKQKDQKQETAFSGSQYGPTVRNDSLWKVADRTNSYSDVTREQMMMAIYEANPKAFYKKNVNALKAGKTLVIPEKEVILSLSKKEAQLAFIKQTDEWSGVVSAKSVDKAKGEVVAKQPTSDSNQGINAQLELKAPTEAEVDETAVVVSEKETALDAGSQSTPDQSGASFNEESFALQARMEKLEQQLAMMQKMLVLKDEQIAALQNKQKLADASGVEKVEEGTVEEKTDLQEETPAITDVIPGTGVESKVEDKSTVETEKEIVTVEPKPVAKVEPEKEEGSSIAMMSVILFPVLGLLGWALWRKGKENNDTDAESMFASASEIIPQDSLADEDLNPSPDKSSAIGGDLDDSSFLSEFESSGFHTFDKEPSEDVDPVLEADVYLAYGRYQQAEELMRQAIIDQPERDECKLKLLEIFHAHENKSAFDEYVTELEKSGKNKDQKFWSKVVEMNDELDAKTSSSSLQNENAGEKASFSIDDSDVSSDTIEERNVVEEEIKDVIDNNDNADKETKPDSLENEAKSDDKDMEFDLSIFDEDEKDLDLDMSLDLDATDKNDVSAIDFDLSEFDLDKPDTSKADNKKSADNAEAIESVDFDLDSIDLDASKPKDAEKGDEIKEEEIESFDFDFDTIPDKDLEVGVSDLTDMDEMETKIDLAKAYIDMGDYDAAQAIAQEAFDRGNEEQKKAAQAILDLLN